MRFATGLAMLLALTAPAWSAPRTVNTIADLVRARDLTDGQVFIVRGYRVPGDDGGGVFLYRAPSDLAPDGGTVFAAERGVGRFLRVIQPHQDAYAEWFGAYGDGDSPQPHDDHAAINACLAALGRVKLLAKTYGVRGQPTSYAPQATYHAIDLAPDYRIEGSGRDRTTLKLLSGTNPHGTSPAENYFQLLGNRDFYLSADHVVVQDLTLDCNFDGQNKHTTIHAIAVRGGGARFQRLNLRGYGTGRHPETGATRECFVIHQTLVYKAAQASRQAATCRDLDFTGCGHNREVGGFVGEITHLALGGADNFGNKSWITNKGADPAWDPANNGENERNWWPSYGGLIEDCVIHDEVYDPATQMSPLNGFTYGDSIGVVIRHNRVTNWEGTAVFTMSWWNRDTVIVDNEFDRVTCGVALNVCGKDGKNNDDSRHENTRIENNTIVLGSPPHAPWGTTGIQLYGEHPAPGVRFRDMLIRGNRISGRAYTNAKGGRVCPIGLKLQILHVEYENLRFEDNILDLPDYAQVPYVLQQPGGQAILYYPLARWEEDQKLRRVTFRGNRTPDGQDLWPMLVGWDFKNPAQVGKP